jgi:3-keto-5-aminohexanoate cleavage enzyme
VFTGSGGHGIESAITPGASHPAMIITVALTGAVPEKSRYPSLPVEPEEIAHQALECAELGASTVHLHMRDENGNQTQDPERLLQTIRLIRADNAELIICATSTSRGSKNIDERLTALRLPPQELPDMVSLTMGSYNTPLGINANPRDEIEALAAAMMTAGVAAELEIFEPGMLYTYFRMLRDKKISKPAIVNILLGVDGASPASARELIHMVDLVPSDTEWAVAGIGAYQKQMVWLGALLGGNVRVGMEDDPRGEHPGWSNPDSVKRAVKIAHDTGREVSSPRAARERLGLALRKN